MKAQRIIAYLFVFIGVGVVLHPWIFQAGVPATIRGENIPEINYIWMLRTLIGEGHAFTPWNSKFLGGEAVLTHGAYPMYWLIALFSWLIDIPVETIYRFLVYGVLVSGGLAVAEYVFLVTGVFYAGAIAGLISALIPGRYNSIDGFYLEISWLLLLWVLLVYERGFVQQAIPSNRSSVAFGTLTGLMVFTSIQIPLMAVFFLLPYMIWREVQIIGANYHEEANGRISFIRKRLRSWLLASAITIGIGAGYYLPVLVDFRHLGFSRYINDPSGVTIPLSFLAEMLTFRWSPEFAPTRWHHLTWYLGDIALLLGGIGLFLGRKQIGIRLFWAGVAIFSLLLLVGDSLGPLTNWLYHFVDGLPILSGALRRSFRFVVPYSLSIAILSGFGVATLTRSLRPHWHGRKFLLASTLATLVVFDLFPHHGSFRILPAYLTKDEQVTIDWLIQQNDQAYRYAIPFNAAYDPNGYLIGYNHSFVHHSWPQPGVWDDSYIVHYVPRRAADLFSIVDANNPLWRPDMFPRLRAMLELSSVRYITLFVDYEPNRLLFSSALAEGFPLRFESHQNKIMEVPNVKPLVQFYSRSALYTGTELQTEFTEILPMLYNAGFALIETSAATPELAVDPDIQFSSASELSDLSLDLAVESAIFNILKWSTPTPSTLEAYIETSQPGVLVAGHAWFPGWHVAVDGIEQPLLRANFAFLGVQLPAGTHTILFSYRPPLYVLLPFFMAGILLLVATLFLIKGILFGPGTATE